jgi:hypothetical protein
MIKMANLLLCDIEERNKVETKGIANLFHETIPEKLSNLGKNIFPSKRGIYIPE